MSLVTPLARPGAQVPLSVELASSSSLVTPPFEVCAAGGSPGSPPATRARVRRFPNPESSRGFPADAATAPGSRPCSQGGTPVPRNSAGVDGDADRERKTLGNDNTCAARRGSCHAPSPAASPATTLALVTPRSGSRGKKIHRTEEELFLAKCPKKIHQRSGDFQTARRRRVSSRRCQYRATRFKKCRRVSAAGNPCGVTGRERISHAYDAPLQKQPANILPGGWFPTGLVPGRARLSKKSPP